jgi:hypothetical protein
LLSTKLQLEGSFVKIFFCLTKMGTLANNSLDLPQRSMIDFFSGMGKNEEKVFKVSILRVGLNQRGKPP